MELIEKTLADLKGFQYATVKHVIEQFYSKRITKVLVADEVGLGKTIVAKGIIAEMYKRHLKKRKKQSSFNVLYICSNLAIARQNVQKLNILEAPIDKADRLTDLAYKPKTNNFIRSFTPDTSFNINKGQGKYKERLLLFQLLFNHRRFKGKVNRLKWFLKGSKRMRDEKWSRMVDEIINSNTGARQNGFYRELRPGFKSAFNKELWRKVPASEYRKLYKALGLSTDRDFSANYILDRISEKPIRKNTYKEKYSPLSGLIPFLRQILAEVCTSFLDANLYILDEFQRFKDLIDESKKDSPGYKIAQHLFGRKKAKVLLLSATPYKPYTTFIESMREESHHKEFEIVLKFLLKKEDFEVVKGLNKRLFTFLRQPEKLVKDIEEAVECKTKIESIYRKYFVRTERAILQKKIGSLVEEKTHPLEDFNKEEIKDFIHLIKIVNYLNEKHKAGLPRPLEFSKSSPFSLSFLEGYKIWKILAKKGPAGDKEFSKLLKERPTLWIPFDKVEKYKPLFIDKNRGLPNPKLKILHELISKSNGWNLLWVPPSLPYYELKGAYKDAADFSKIFIFSSWNFVPKMISSIISYEADRLTIGKHLRKQRKDLSYFGDGSKRKKSPIPALLTIKTKGETIHGFNNYLLTYPSPYLATLYDPATNLLKKKTYHSIKTNLKNKIKRKLRSLGVLKMRKKDGDWQKWYWFAVLLLDKDFLANKPKATHNTFHEGIARQWGSIKDGYKNSSPKHIKNVKRYFSQIENYIFNDLTPNLGILSNKQFNSLVDYIADLTLGSPAICTLRALRKTFDEETSSADFFEHSYKIAQSFRSFFNKPENIACIQMNTSKKEYHRKVLQYCINGNIQAMLDEYFFLLKANKSVSSIKDLEETVNSILTIRRSLTDVKDIKNIFTKKRKKIGTHFALNFNLKNVESTSGRRQISIREAFNSPFKPFVLASTSIGQEGLDFHLYCKHLFHWNLPHNPIDLEQREGRINRYISHAIRLNLARNDSLLGNIRTDEHSHPWKSIFEITKKQFNTCWGLIPYWLIENPSIKIINHIPLYPFSKESIRHDRLKIGRMFYRFTLGQPRQNELVNILAGEEEDKEFLLETYNKIMLTLSPVQFRATESKCHE